MREILIVCLSLIAAAQFFGFSWIEKTANEAFNMGKLAGAERCVKYEASELVSSQSTRAVCVEKFHTLLRFRESATGRANVEETSGNINLTGTLDNKTSRYVTSWVQFGLSVYDAEGTKTEFVASTPIWIEPLSSSEFEVTFDGLPAKKMRQMTWCKEPSGTATNCFLWSVKAAKGLSV